MEIPEKVWLALEENAKFSVKSNMVYSCLVGSASHNTYVPKSDDDHSIDDIDVYLITVPPKKYIYGLSPWKESCQIQLDEWDVLANGLRKYTHLLLKGNPNCIGTLWVRPEERRYVHPVFESTYLKERDIFSSKETFHSFAGYANEQLRKMTSFENAYKGYMGEKRKKLVDKYGFDCKNGTHLIRLLAMCKEFMDTGILNVYRTHDAALLKDIKSGKYSLAQVREMANDMFVEAKSAYEKSALPAAPNTKRAEEILMELTDCIWQSNV